jgi:hypothetical protein
MCVRVYLFTTCSEDVLQVLLTDLPPDTVIYYTVDTLPNGVALGTAEPPQFEVRHQRNADLTGTGSSQTVVDMHHFRTSPATPASTVRFVAMADVGDPVSHSWTAIPEMSSFCNATAHGIEPGPPFTLGLHIGDIAYNLDIPPRGDDYVDGISPMVR